MNKVVNYFVSHDFFNSFKTMKKGEILKHFFLWIFGIFILPLGSLLVKHSGFGAGAGEVLNFALRDLLHIDIAIAVYITAAIYVIIATIARRGLFNWPTIITFLLVGVCTSFWERVLINVDGTGKSVLFVQIPLFVAGMLVLALGAGIMISSIFPANAMDDLVEAFNRERGVPLWVMKLVLDGGCVLIGFLLAMLIPTVENTVNIGTLVITLFIGPLFDLSKWAVCKVFKIEYITKKQAN